MRQIATTDIFEKSLQNSYLSHVFYLGSSDTLQPTNRYIRHDLPGSLRCLFIIFNSPQPTFFPKHFRPQPKSNRVRAMFLIAYVCHKRDQQLVMRCYANSVELVTGSVGHSRRVYLIVAGSLFVFLVNFLFELVSES